MYGVTKYWIELNLWPHHWASLIRLLWEFTKKRRRKSIIRVGPLYQYSPPICIHTYYRWATRTLFFLSLSSRLSLSLSKIKKSWLKQNSKRWAVVRPSVPKIYTPVLKIRLVHNRHAHFIKWTWKSISNTIYFLPLGKKSSYLLSHL